MSERDEWMRGGQVGEMGTSGREEDDWEKGG